MRMVFFMTNIICTIFCSCAKMKKEVLKYMGELDVYRNRCR
jgi:hypothetical protein